MDVLTGVKLPRSCLAYNSYLRHLFLLWGDGLCLKGIFRKIEFTDLRTSLSTYPVPGTMAGSLEEVEWHVPFSENEYMTLWFKSGWLKVPGR